MAGIAVTYSTASAPPQPAYVRASGNPTLPAWCDTFAPHLASVDTGGSKSSIASYQKAVPAGRMMLVQGDNFTGSTSLRSTVRQAAAMVRMRSVKMPREPRATSA